MVDWKNKHLNLRLFYFFYVNHLDAFQEKKNQSVTSNASGMLALNTVQNNALYSRKSRSKCTSRMFCILSWFLQSRSQHGESKEKQTNYCGGPEESTVPSVVKGTTLAEHVQSNLIAKHLI